MPLNKIVSVRGARLLKYLDLVFRLSSNQDFAGLVLIRLLVLIDDGCV
jgi:hypothetical protein